jgi:hypothetical protein
MTMRALTKRVTFIRPFVLKGLEGVQPSGTYSVETREGRAGFFSFLNAKRTSTSIRVCRNPGICGVLQEVEIDPLDLAAALMRDAVPTEVAGPKLHRRR